MSDGRVRVRMRMRMMVMVMVRVRVRAGLTNRHQNPSPFLASKYV